MGAGWQPFLGQEAVARGELTAWELRTHYRSVYRNVYVPKSAVLTATAGLDTASADTVLSYAGRKYRVRKAVTGNGQLVGVKITVQRDKQTRLLVNAYVEMVTETYR